MYDRSLLDQGLGGDPEAHAEEHQRMIYQGILRHRGFEAKGAKTSLKTWLSWLGAAQDVIHKWHSWLLTTCYLCLQRGLFVKQT